MTEVRGMSCCGIGEIISLSSSHSPREALLRTADEMQNYGMIIFTGVVQYIDDYMPCPTYCQDFAKLLEEKKLGKITSVTNVYNPNSGNRIGIWVLEVDRPRMVKESLCPCGISCFSFSHMFSMNLQRGA